MNNATKQTHTPTPWRYVIHKDGAFLLPDGNTHVGSIMIYKENKELMKAIAIMPLGNNENVNNAEFIVRAVNSHDELVEALQFITKNLCFNNSEIGTKGYLMAKQVLTKVEDK